MVIIGADGYIFSCQSIQVHNDVKFPLKSGTAFCSIGFNSTSGYQQPEALAIVRQLAGETGTTVARAYHNLGIAAWYAGTPLMLRSSQTVSSGEPDGIVTQERVRGFCEVGTRIVRNPKAGLILEPFRAPFGVLS